MLDTSNLSKFLKGITDAIRTKKGTTEPIEHKVIDEEIESIEDTGIGSRQWWIDILNKKWSYLQMFYGCQSLIVTPLLDMSNCKTAQDMCLQCGYLIKANLINTSKCTNWNYTFGNCMALTSISLLDFSSCSSCTGTFYNCYNLENVSFVAESIKKSITFQYSEKLTDESIQSIIDGLAVATTAQTITFNSTVFDKITDKQLATIYEKGWSLAGYEINND